MSKRENKVNEFLEDMLELQKCKLSNKFTGELAKNRQPRKWPMVGATLLLDEDSKKEAIAKCNAEYKKKSMEYFLEDYQKLLLLCEHYGIEQANIKDKTGASHIYMLAQLSIALAEELKVPAFTEKKRRGPKEKWTEFTMALLIAAVKEKVEDKKSQNKEEDEEKLISSACKTLSGQEPWKNFLSVGEETLSSDALRHKYYEAKKLKLSNFLGENLAIAANFKKDLFKSILNKHL